MLTCIYCVILSFVTIAPILYRLEMQALLYIVYALNFVLFCCVIRGKSTVIHPHPNSHDVINNSQSVL